MKHSAYFADTTNLQAIEADCWKLLARAATDGKSDFRLPVLGTVAEGVAAQRIVVLRKVDTESGALFIHTDRRSAKFSQLQQDPSASLLFYDKAKKVQIRATTSAILHVDDAIADAIWESESATSLKGYLGPLSPGTTTQQPEHNLPEEFIDRIPQREDLTPARQNFAVVQFVVNELLWLQLNRSGHLQAQFQYDADRTLQASWVAP